MGRNLTPNSKIGFIHIDASINPGISGESLINVEGEVIGIFLRILVPDAINVGIGLAAHAAVGQRVLSNKHLGSNFFAEFLQQPFL